MCPYDLIIRDCTVVDPVNGRNEVASVAIKEGKIAAIGNDLSGKGVRQVIALPGMILTPGMIDTHVHCSDWLGGALAFGMMARAGVTTAVDFAGPVSSVIDLMSKNGSGINVAVLEAIHPGVSVQNNNPTYEESASLLEKSIRAGAIGLKLIGGHYPLTPEASNGAIRAAVDRRCYVACHAGSTKNGSNIKGVIDAVDFADGNPFHLAHINAYCRGMVDSPREEVAQAIQLLIDNPQIISEFHLAPLNGTSGKCANGVPESHITRNCLRAGGFAETEKGLCEAFDAGYAQCVMENVDGENRYICGKRALEYWRAADGVCTCSFPVNNRETAFLCATSTNKSGKFVIDALSTDGGGIPRNFLIKYGYLLVEWGAWSLNDYVLKTSGIPARMLGLTQKGHLSIGADADITVFNPVTKEAVLTVVGGHIRCINGVLTSSKGTILCLKEGCDAIESAGLDFHVVDLEKSMLYSARESDQ